jgi:hypothetical protein
LLITGLGFWIGDLNFLALFGTVSQFAPSPSTKAQGERVST